MNKKTKVFLFLLFPLLTSLIISLTPQVKATSTEQLYVNAFSDENVNSTKIGASPYLDASDYPTNYISSDNKPLWDDGIWSFENTTLTNATWKIIQLNATWVSGSTKMNLYYIYKSSLIYWTIPSTYQTFTLNSSWAIYSSTNRTLENSTSVDITNMFLACSGDTPASFRQVVYVDMARLYVGNGTNTEYLYANAFSDEPCKYTKHGSSPYLDALRINSR